METIERFMDLHFESATVGFCAEDDAAASVVAAALAHDWRPAFHDVKGAYAEVRFAPPSGPAPSPSPPALRGWLETLPRHHVIQLLQRESPCAEGRAEAPTTVSPESHHVSEELSHVLHLWSASAPAEEDRRGSVRSIVTWGEDEVLLRNACQTVVGLSQAIQAHPSATIEVREDAEHEYIRLVVPSSPPVALPT